MRLVISDPKTGKSYQTDLTKEFEANVVGKKIGEELEGNLIGAAGYKLQLTGGSDQSGFPMRRDVTGQRKIRALLSGGVGFNPQNNGERKRKLIRGNTFSAEIAQINAKVLGGEGQPFEQLFPKKEEKKAK